MSTKTDAIFAKITDQVIDALESASADGWKPPWASMFGVNGIPVNALTRRPYRGLNALWFMLVGTDADYTTNIWATYKQWAQLGGQVRKGESGTHGIKWGVTYACSTCNKTSRQPCDKDDHTSARRMFASPFVVFNLDQQDGYVPDLPEPPNGATVVDEIEAFAAATGANITHAAQGRAYYRPGTNDITLPLRETFESTEGYYSTLLHELTHWTGDDSRLNREQRNFFGTEKYAAEELVAELGSVFLQINFGLAPEPSLESASYLKNWLTVLRSDTRALYRAASLAEKAVTYLQELTADEPVGASHD